MLYILSILWAVCVSFGPMYNIVGNIGIFTLIITIMILLNKIRLDNKFMICIVAFMVFFSYKTIGEELSLSIQGYHSVYRVIIRWGELIAFMFAAQTLLPLFENYNYKFAKIFNVSYHISILISIVILILKGERTYRLGVMGEGGILLAPQFFVTISIFVIAALVYLIINDKRNRWMRAGLICINTIYLFMASYTTQMVFAMLGIIIVIIFSKLKRNSDVILISFLIMLLVAISPIISPCMEFIGRTLFETNHDVSVRMNEIAMLLRFENLEGTDIQSRFDLIALSLNTFMSNPLLGVPFSSYNTDLTGIIVGGHCEWADDLARCGILGMIVFSFFVIKSLYKVLLIEHKDNAAIKKALLVIIILYGFFNPIIRYDLFYMLYMIMQFVYAELSYMHKRCGEGSI